MVAKKRNHASVDILSCTISRSNTVESTCKFTPKEMAATVVPIKSDSDVIVCLQLLSKTRMRTLHLS